MSKITLTGHDTQEVHYWSEEYNNLLTTGEIVNLTYRVSFWQTDKGLRVTWSEHGCVMQKADGTLDLNPKKGSVILPSLGDIEPTVDTHYDNSGGLWIDLNYIGQYLSWGREGRGDWFGLLLQQHVASGMFSVHINWYDKGKHSRRHNDFFLMYLDEKSQLVWLDLVDRYREE